MNVYDELLTWFSERQSGSMASARTACGWAASHIGDGADPLGLLDDLRALGHIHLDARSWTIVPPTLTRLADGGGNGLLVGARPVWLVQALERAFEGNSPEPLGLGDHLLDTVVVEQKGPSTWFLTFGPEAPLAELESLGVHVEDDLAGRSLNGLRDRGVPTVRRTVRPGEMYARLVAQANVLAEGPLWESTSGDASAGVYCYLRNGRKIFAVRDTEGWIEMDRSWAIWNSIPEHLEALWIVPRQRSFYAPEGVRLPIELERSLVLRTGRLPEVVTDSSISSKFALRRYQNVTHAIAENVGRFLSREVHSR